jgi:hypothetical protein
MATQHAGLSPEAGAPSLNREARCVREGVQRCRQWLPDGVQRTREDAAVRCDVRVGARVDGFLLVLVMGMV